MLIILIIPDYSWLVRLRLLFPLFQVFLYLLIIANLQSFSKFSLVQLFSLFLNFFCSYSCKFFRLFQLLNNSYFQLFRLCSKFNYSHYVTKILAGTRLGMLWSLKTRSSRIDKTRSLSLWTQYQTSRVACPRTSPNRARSTRAVCRPGDGGLVRAWNQLRHWRIIKILEII